MVALLLKRPAGVNHRVGAQRANTRGQIAGGTVESGAVVPGLVCRTQGVRELPRFCGVALAASALQNRPPKCP